MVVDVQNSRNNPRQFIKRENHAAASVDAKINSTATTLRKTQGAFGMMPEITLSRHVIVSHKDVAMPIHASS